MSNSLNQKISLLPAEYNNIFFSKAFHSENSMHILFLIQMVSRKEVDIHSVFMQAGIINLKSFCKCMFLCNAALKTKSKLLQ